MVVVEKGVKYRLEIVPKGEANDSYIEVEFIRRVGDNMFPGITNEEIIKMMRDRFRHLCGNARGNSENFKILSHLDEIESLLYKIRDRNVKRKAKDEADLDEPIKQIHKSVFGSVTHVR